MQLFAMFPLCRWEGHMMVRGVRHHVHSKSGFWCLCLFKKVPLFSCNVVCTPFLATIKPYPSLSSCNAYNSSFNFVKVLALKCWNIILYKYADILMIYFIFYNGMNEQIQFKHVSSASSVYVAYMCIPSNINHWHPLKSLIKSTTWNLLLLLFPRYNLWTIGCIAASSIEWHKIKLSHSNNCKCAIELRWQVYSFS